MLACRTGAHCSDRTREPYPDSDKTAAGRQRWLIMAWFVLIVSGMFEAVWAIALGKTEGFSKLLPSLVFAGGLIVSMSGLAYAMKDIPTGTAYAVWVGIGASLTVIYGMAVDGESISWIKVLLLMLLVGCVVGLKYVE